MHVIKSHLIPLTECDTETVGKLRPEKAFCVGVIPMFCLNTIQGVNVGVDYL